MRTARFFRMVWRANAVLILVAGVLASAMGVLGLGLAWKESARPRTVRGVVNTSGPDLQQETFQLGQFVRFTGMRSLRATLTSYQEYDQGRLTKNASATRNYLFFDPETRRGRWLWPTNAQVLLAADDLFFPPGSRRTTEETPLRGTLLVVVAEDTNGDHRLTEQDTKSLAVISPDGHDLKTVVTPLDAFYGEYVAGPDEALVFYTQRETMMAASIDLATLTVRWSEPLRSEERP